MPKKINIEIQESAEYLQKAYSKAKGSLSQDRLKVLFYLKTGKYCYQRELAQKLGRTEKTIRVWLKTYREQGMDGYLAVKSGGNNTRSLSDKVISFIAEQVQNEQTTITSYVELQAKIEAELQEKIAYGALYSHCRRKHKSKLKVARKSHYKKAMDAITIFKKT